jgi:hypothetical protein
MNEARERLIKAICIIAAELDIDPVLTKACVETLSKDELIEKYIELKDTRLKKENLRLVELLIG